MFGLLSVTSEKLSGDISSFLSFAKEAFLTIRISDVIDILLLATLFFFAFRFLRNRKVGALIVGILICLVAYALATIFGLSGLKFIL